MLAAATLWIAIPVVAVATEPQQLRVDWPTQGAQLRRSIPLLEVRGRTGAAELYDADVALAIDLSQSVLLASGVDVDEDGIVGETETWAKTRRLRGRHPARWTSDPGDTVLEAEMLAARAIIEGLASRKNRVGVLTYTEVARVRAWLGPPEDALVSLDAIHHRLNSKGSDIARAIEAGARMLGDPPEGPGHSRSRAILLFTDGSPLPKRHRPESLFGASDSGLKTSTPSPAPVRPEHWARKAALDAAKKLAEEEITLYIFRLGESDDDTDQFLFDLAAAARAPLIPVEQPRALLADLPSVDLQPRRFEIQNLTTGSSARAVRTSRDGWFDGFVNLVPGANEILVKAQLIDGTEVSERRVVHYEKPAVESELDRRRAAAMLVALRARTAQVESYDGPPRAPGVETAPGPAPETAPELARPEAQ